MSIDHIAPTADTSVLTAGSAVYRPSTVKRDRRTRAQLEVIDGAIIEAEERADLLRWTGAGR